MRACDECGRMVPIDLPAEGRFVCEACKAKMRQPETSRPISRDEALAISNETMCKAEEERQAQDFPVPSSAPRAEEYAELLDGLDSLQYEGRAIQKIGDEAIATIRNLCAQNDELSKMIDAQQGCPYGDPLHDHHDGCPSEYAAEEQCERFACTIDRLHAELDRNGYEHSQEVTELRRRITLLMEEEPRKQRDILAAGLRKIKSVETHGWVFEAGWERLISIASDALREAGLEVTDGRD